MRRILIVSAYYSPHMGGVERYTENLAKKLTELGNEVVILTSSNSERSYGITSDGVGASVVNALSEWMEVYVKRDGHIYNQRYERIGRASCRERV